MLVSVVDIGTNTVLLLIVRFEASGEMSALAYEQRVPRLGKDVDSVRNMAPDSMRRVVDVLLEYKKIMSDFSIDSSVVCATSAVRDAHNKDEFASLIRSETGFELEILSGKDEALWSYRGAVSGIRGLQKATVIDIGGGSTEITLGEGERVIKSISLDIGSVRLTERFFTHDPPTHPELEAAITFVEDELARAKEFDFGQSALVGVAGTATALAILDQGLTEFSVEAVTNYTLKLDNVYALFRTLRSMPARSILERSSVMQGRNDIITAGVLILREIMAHYKFTEMIVSERGVRYGIAIREWEKESLWS